MIADLVVVGAGGAGLPAALAAQEQGLPHVVVLEKRSVLGGNAGMSGGFLFAAGSGPQQRAGVGADVDALFRETMAYFQYDGIDAELIRLWVDEADGNVDWLESLGVGYRVMPGGDLCVEPSGWSNHPGSFKRVMDLIAEQVVARGGEVLTRTPAVALARTDAGWRVTAEGPDGVLSIDTTRVLLSSGGFTGNVALLQEHFAGVYDENVYWTDAKRLSGDGIDLAREGGGAVDGRTFLVKENCYSFKTKKNKPNRAALDGSTLWVNRDGRRFLDESLGRVNASTNALVEQPGMTGFAIFDDALVQSIMDRPNPFEAELRPGEDDPGTWTAEGFRTTLRDQLADPDNDEWCTAAETVEELAGWIGCDADVLVATLEQYNGYCDAGRDALWAKPAELLVPLRKAPFYALRFRPIMIDTAGPVRVDGSLRVLDHAGVPVPGLYAAGALTSGWIGRDEHRFGTPLSWVIASGRVAGKHAATNAG